ncbi:bifunctional GNAT family N-acetyltransferase/serine/threonine-protein kinase [Criblamydia sequanensis]|uniref:Serine/threonine-protein kinase n=1 Tax=Candidatus Criblamydia sequanensis CRIB-18 TaxID=1437425 RepID=A0A090D1Z5_9BACT|nr:bifunctional GNAT family N-acetyltransferase/serine/threonine-protein kinase [Criblamydia sequanensis]CDR33913.1 putative serine/threonine-protein kinase [Criblamydia sequanensis CRIB-18]
MQGSDSLSNSVKQPLFNFLEARFRRDNSESSENSRLSQRSPDTEVNLHKRKFKSVPTSQRFKKSRSTPYIDFNESSYSFKEKVDERFYPLFSKLLVLQTQTNKTDFFCKKISNLLEHYESFNETFDTSSECFSNVFHLALPILLHRNLLIRNGSLKDADIVSRFKKIFPDKSPLSIQSALDNKGDFIREGKSYQVIVLDYVGCRVEKAVGFIFHSISKEKAKILCLEVTQGYAGNDLGTFLLESALNRIRNAGVQKVYTKKYESALIFFQRNGFKETPSSLELDLETKKNSESRIRMKLLRSDRSALERNLIKMKVPRSLWDNVKLSLLRSGSLDHRILSISPNFSVLFDRSSSISKAYLFSTENIIAHGAERDIFKGYDLSREKIRVMKKAVSDREVEIMTSLKKEKTVESLKAVIPLGNTEGNLLVTTHYSGSLGTFVLSNPIGKPKELLKIAFQLFETLRIFHSNRFIDNEKGELPNFHGDIHPFNILFKKTKAGKVKFVLSDFGTSNCLELIGGTTPWRSPAHERYYYEIESVKYSDKEIYETIRGSDVWGLALSFATLISPNKRDIPLNSVNSIFEKVKKGLADKVDKNEVDQEIQVEIDDEIAFFMRLEENPSIVELWKVIHQCLQVKAENQITAESASLAIKAILLKMKA